MLNGPSRPAAVRMLRGWQPTPRLAACAPTSSGMRKLRARQTADALSACNPSAEFSAIRGLQPTDPPEWIRDRLVGDEREILLAGHFPSLPRILHLLVTGPSDGGAEGFPLHGLVALERHDDVWIVKWRLEGGA
jgi:phosphohistidine phosphatase SixA